MDTTPRSTLRSHILRKEAERTSVPIITMEVVKVFVEQNFSCLALVSERADVGGNKMKHFLVISRKLKAYDNELGPYDALKVVVREDCMYKLIAYDKVVEENAATIPLASSSIIQSLEKLANTALVACPGIEQYSTYKLSIGFDLKRVQVVRIPSDSARDQECTYFFDSSPNSRSSVCSKCCSLKRHLTRRKKEHDEMSPTTRSQRQSSSSHSQFSYLSPSSKRARLENMRKTARSLKFAANYYSLKVEKTSINEIQNQEVGQLIDSIVISEEGQRHLQQIISEANDVTSGLGNVVEEVWKEDYSQWMQFRDDQITNSR